MKIIVILAMILFASCANVDNPMNPEIDYKMDMKINGVSGMVVMPMKESNSIEFESPGKLDYFSFKTCSRDVAIEKAGGWLSKNKTTYVYRPNAIEQLAACDAEIWGFEKSKGRHALGYIIFSNGQDVLNGTVTCGESTKSFLGTSVCQGHRGFKQRIEFDRFVYLESMPECAIEQKEGFKFDITLKPGLCNYVFMSRDFEAHRLVTYGFDQTMVRE